MSTIILQGRHLCVSAAILLLSLAGCSQSDGLISVTGTVTFEGEPVEKGAISMIPVDGAGVTAGGVIAGGRYHVRSSPGKVSVLIYGQRKTENPNASPEEIERGMNFSTKQYVPAAYNDQSKLRITISESNRNFDFDLTQQGEIPAEMSGT
ncbi:MAG: hypothetical protein ACIALR_04920 [Blastopirellula sp. JB062]